MDAKHQFKYTYAEGCEDFSPVEVTFDIPGEVTLSQMLYNFQSYLKACGFVFDGDLEIVDHTFDVMKDQDDIDEVYGCMDISSSLEKFNEDLSKLDKEVKKNNWVHGICNPPSSDYSNQKNG